MAFNCIKEYLTHLDQMDVLLEPFSNDSKTEEAFEAHEGCEEVLI